MAFHHPLETVGETLSCNSSCFEMNTETLCQLNSLMLLPVPLLKVTVH